MIQRVTASAIALALALPSAGCGALIGNIKDADEMKPASEAIDKDKTIGCKAALERAKAWSRYKTSAPLVAGRRYRSSYSSLERSATVRCTRQIREAGKRNAIGEGVAIIRTWRETYPESFPTEKRTRGSWGSRGSLTALGLLEK